MKTTCVLMFAAATLFASEDVQFNRDIRPILSDRCYACHGPDKGNRKTKMRLHIEADAKASIGRNRFPIVPGGPGKCEIYKRISSTNKAVRMPPAYLGHDKLPDAQIELVRKWIEQGAKYQQHWSFIPPVKAELPKVQDQRWPKSEIDYFVLSRLERESMKPSPDADERTLIRRVTLDLTGLPPTPEEVSAFVYDDSAGAYERVVDRLLASPRYAERMTARWLDAARYADRGVKFDPITQKDYYSLFALFNNFPEKGFVWNFGNEEPVIKAPSLEQQKACGAGRESGGCGTRVRSAAAENRQRAGEVGAHAAPRQTADSLDGESPTIAVSAARVCRSMTTGLPR